jgi:cytidine deaminase
MRKKELYSTFYEFLSLSELTDRDKKLVDKARNVALSAYAPYSDFQVGAAVLLDNERIITGNNQENAAFPSGLCAERVAVFYAKSQFPGSAIHAIAIAATSKNKEPEFPTSPCGACLQVLMENEIRDNHSIRVVLYGSKRILMAENVRQFLPLGFNAEKF